VAAIVNTEMRMLVFSGRGPYHARTVSAQWFFSCPDAAIRGKSYEMTESGSGDLSGLRDQFIAAQLAGDRRKALDLIAQVPGSSAATPSAIRAQVIRAAQAEIGRLWQANAISVAQEHMATAISHLALAALFNRDRPNPPNGRTVIVACVEGELHEFPARLVADELDVAGFAVRFLGASVPTEHLLTFIAREEPDLIVLSATLALHADAVRTAVRRIREMTRDRIPIAVGGQICESVTALAAELAVPISGCDADALVEDARRLLGVPQ
jgi:methanogenic corrinoid protein MtbC1